MVRILNDQFYGRVVAEIVNDFENTCVVIVRLKSLAGKVYFINVLTTVLHQGFYRHNCLIRLTVKGNTDIHIFRHSERVMSYR